MTRRVLDCHQPALPDAPRPLRAARAPTPSGGGFTAAVLTSLVVVPLVGARDPDTGLVAALLTAASLLLLHRRRRGRVRWGGLAVLVALVEIVAPSSVRSPLEPVLIVAFCLCSMVWLVQSMAADRVQPPGERPPPGSAERQAQLDLGRAGERHVGSVLASELPDDFVLVNGLKLRHAPGDIDHLVIGPTGVFLLETKTMAGQVVCNPNGTWQRTRQGRGGRYAAYIGDPAAQVLRNVHAVRRVLHGALPWLFQGAPLWIEGLIVFPHPKTELAATHSRVPAVRLEEAARTICQHQARRRLGPGEVDEVLDSLLNGAEGAPRLRTAQSAQALIEVALALPVVLLVLVGVVGLSRLVQAQSGLVTVVHEAARAGALGFGPVDAEQRAGQRGLSARPARSAPDQLGRSDPAVGRARRMGRSVPQRPGATDSGCPMTRHTHPAQALVWLTLMLPLFLAMAGLAIDGAVLLTARRELQSVADGAARAGATEVDLGVLRASNGEAVRLDSTRATARAAAYLRDRLPREVQLQSEPTTSVSTTSTGVQVRISAEIGTAFLRALHIDTFPVEATAAADVRHGIQQAVP
jgi:Flp pilus assembly protein TadG